MQLTRATRYLQEIFRDPAAATAAFLRETPRGATALQIFYRLHLPLLLTYPIAAALSPLVHLSRRGLSPIKHIILPLMLVAAFYVLALLFDRVIRYAQHPRLEDPDETPIRDVALFLHLPLAAAGIFFVIHPLLGLLTTVLAGLHCIWISLDTTATCYGLSRAKAITHWISALFLLLIPVTALLLARNVLITVRAYAGG